MGVEQEQFHIYDPYVEGENVTLLNNFFRIFSTNYESSFPKRPHCSNIRYSLEQSESLDKKPKDVYRDGARYNSYLFANQTMEESLDDFEKVAVEVTGLELEEIQRIVTDKDEGYLDILSKIFIALRKKGYSKKELFG